MTAYSDFLERKTLRVESRGIDPGAVHSMLYPFQRRIVEWAIRKGRAAIFADCGLGKSLMQIEWARQCGAGGRTLFVAPLSVAEQTIAEAARVGVEIDRVNDPSDAPFQITNYQKLHRFTGTDYRAVVLDESSILKSIDGKTRSLILSEFTSIPFRLACTATPAPNDIAELGNHSEFVGALPRVEMLASFFVHDEQTWRLKGHARDAFWRWCASWSCYLRKPSDIGEPDGDFILPELRIRDEVVSSDYRPTHSLFALGGIHDRRDARRQSIGPRVARAVELIRESPGQWLVWCGLNDEGDALESGTPGAIQVSGQHDEEWRHHAIEWFAGRECLCDVPEFAAKMESWRETPNTSVDTTGQTPESSSARRNSSPLSTPGEESATQATPHIVSKPSQRRQRGSRPTLQSGSTSECGNTGSQELTISGCSKPNKDAAPSAKATLREPRAEPGFTLTTAIEPGASEGCSATTATQESGSSPTTPLDSKTRPCICGHQSGRRILVSKTALFGFGLNLQTCHQMMFLGLGDSYEQYYQAIRRCWRFGQKSAVDVVIVTSTAEGSVAANVRRKEDDAARISAGVVEHMKDAMAEELATTPKRQRQDYREDIAKGEGWDLRLGDCVTRVKEIVDGSIGLSVFSPPFASLYTYSASDRDMGNARSVEEFRTHFRHLIPELLRVTTPGRRCCVHTQQMALRKGVDGVIGMFDLRATLVADFVAAGWVYDGEIVIDKDPQAQAIRTRSKSLLFVQKNKDSSWSRPAMADYILLFRHPGDNPVPIVPDVSNEEWICWARPIWYGIHESNTLQAAEARGNDDERHICPLQLETIERCVRLWSNPGERVLSPFAGIGSEGVVSVQKGRQFSGIELKPEYWKVAAKNLRGCNRQVGLFDALAVGT